MKAKTKFPKQLIASWEESMGDDRFLSANEGPEDVAISPGETRTVGVYELKEVQKLTCVVELKTENGARK